MTMFAVGAVPPIDYDANLSNLLTHAQYDQLAYFYNMDFGTQGVHTLPARAFLLSAYVFGN
jgi:hypothetical protein